MSDSDSDYEYEYHPSETESLYLNLDLSSIHGPIRPPRRRPSQASPDEDDTPIDSTETDTVQHRAQLLGLHTPNPIVSYQNQIFSCSWADQLGTELFFAHPETEPEPGPGQLSNGQALPTLRQGRDYDLLAANSVKLLGRKADLISASAPASIATPTPTPTPTATTSATTANIPRKQGPQTNQSRFLERLMEIKQAKGETDPVRTAYSARRDPAVPSLSQGQAQAQAQAHDRQHGWTRTETHLADIHRLNEAALRGDVDAIVALQQLSARIGVDVDGAGAEAVGEDHNSRS